MLRDTYLKINVDYLLFNMQAIDSFISKDTIIGAVLKANAYGHGAKVIAKCLYNKGYNRFLVATLLEAVALKNDNPDYNILIMGHTPNDYLEEAVKRNISVTLFTLEQAELLNQLSKKYNKISTVHLKIETGFNRLGLQITNETVAIIQTIFDLHYLNVEGAFTHLSLESKESDFKQFALFKNLMAQLEESDIHIDIQHVCDSIAMVLYPEMQLDMVRVGAIIYGLQSEESGCIKVKPILSFHTKLSYQKLIKKGESISYGNRWVAKRDTYIGTLPFGYADGYPRNMYQKGAVFINDKFFDIVGVICMDQCMINLGKDPIDKTFEVDIMGGNGLSISVIATLSGTNKNDIVSRFSARVPRVYIINESIFEIEHSIL